MITAGEEAGRVLADPTMFGGTTQRLRTENPERSFDSYLMNSEGSLFRRHERVVFDRGADFFNLSSAEFAMLCYQRAIVDEATSFNAKVEMNGLLVDLMNHLLCVVVAANGC